MAPGRIPGSAAAQLRIDRTPYPYFRNTTRAAP